MNSTDTNIIRYPVMEHFATLQGEGFYTGTAAYFIRLAGCDVGCVWCDVKESWTADESQYRSLDEIILFTENFEGSSVVITGGEPAIYDLQPLISALQKKGFKVHIETSGAYPVLGSPDWITVSPKKFKSPIVETLRKADELKVIVFNKSDFDWAEQHKAFTNEKCLLFLQPEYSKHADSAALIVQYILEHPEWKLSLQTHKFIGIP